MSRTRAVSPRRWAGLAAAVGGAAFQVRSIVDDTDIVEAGAQPPELGPAASSHELACAVHRVWFVGARRVHP
jgi:hypothetical protein